jgi:hypothetical protein
VKQAKLLAVASGIKYGTLAQQVVKFHVVSKIFLSYFVAIVEGVITEGKALGLADARGQWKRSK